MTRLVWIGLVVLLLSAPVTLARAEDVYLIDGLDEGSTYYSSPQIKPRVVDIKFTPEDVYRCSLDEPGHYACKPVDYADPLAMGCQIAGFAGVWICP